MTEGRKSSIPLGVILVVAGSALAGWNWVLRPEHALAWGSALAMFACMAVALLLANRGPRTEQALNAARQIEGAVIFAGLMMTVALMGKLSATFGLWGGEDLARRGTQITMGLFFAFTGNAMPKTLTPLSALRCDPARVQAFQRFAGWSWVLTGLSYSLVWLMLPIALAQTVSIIVLVIGIVVVAMQIIRLRGSRSKVA
jgi:hypothetical protein